MTNSWYPVLRLQVSAGWSERHLQAAAEGGGGGGGGNFLSGQFLYWKLGEAFQHKKRGQCTNSS